MKIFILIALVFQISACSLTTDRKNEVDSEPQQVSSGDRDPYEEEILQEKPLAAVNEDNLSDKLTEELLQKAENTSPAAIVAATPVVDVNQEATIAAPPEKVENHKAISLSGVDPEVAFRYLRNGNTRFLKGTLRNDGQSKKDIQRLSKGQKPHSIIFSCSDSRVPPEVVFDQKLGEVFVVRSAGQAIDASQVASMEYAVDHLGVRQLVVMGHTSCGAVKASLETLDGKSTGSGNLDHLVKDIHPRIAGFKGQAPSGSYEKESWANVDGIERDLLSRSQILSQRVQSGELKIRKALYYMDSGKVVFR